MINRKKILVADSDPLNLKFFDLMLNKLGFKFEKAEDGQSAIDKIASFQPDLILLETVLPKVSGWDVLKSVRSDPKTETLPVILLSNIDNVSDIIEGFELGADDYIVKPFNFSVLLARIRASLRSRMLISELNARESRLALFEKANKSMKKNINELKNDLDKLSAGIDFIEKKTLNKKTLKEYVRAMREVIESSSESTRKIETCIKDISKKWISLKQNEIGLPILQTPIRKPVGEATTSPNGKDTE
ncbi:MAG: hypothetical protein Ta2G_07510 [Termitinemataceae bacterium]|nr:MAG: hypothetical protein Ta2G_07510 [Termitinemataceae bacterium]